MTGRRAATRRRGRPRSSDRGSELEPREEILRHAARLFSAKGLGATRLADVAEAVGVKAPAIYYHFANLDAIVAHLLDYVVDESAAFATRSAAAAGSSRDRLWALVEHHVRRLTEGPYDLWFVAGLSDDDRARFPGVTATADRWRDPWCVSSRRAAANRRVRGDRQQARTLGRVRPRLRRSGAASSQRSRRCGTGRRSRHRRTVATPVDPSVNRGGLRSGGSPRDARKLVMAIGRIGERKTTMRPIRPTRRGVREFEVDGSAVHVMRSR